MIFTLQILTWFLLVDAVTSNHDIYADDSMSYHPYGVLRRGKFRFYFAIYYGFCVIALHRGVQMLLLYPFGLRKILSKN